MLTLFLRQRLIFILPEVCSQPSALIDSIEQDGHTRNLIGMVGFVPVKILNKSGSQNLP